jgi:hypothetical protein
LKCPPLQRSRKLESADKPVLSPGVPHSLLPESSAELACTKGQGKNYSWKVQFHELGRAGGLKTGSIRQQESNGSKMKEGEVEVSSASKVAAQKVRGRIIAGRCSSTSLDGGKHRLVRGFEFPRKEGEVEVSSASKVAETRIRGQAGAFPRPSSWNCTK